MFLIVMVITDGSDYANIINQRPDFLIAGEFSESAQKMEAGQNIRHSRRIKIH